MDARSASVVREAYGAHEPKGIPMVQVLTVSSSERINEVPEYGQEYYPVWAVKRQLAGCKSSGSLLYVGHCMRSRRSLAKPLSR